MEAELRKALRKRGRDPDILRRLAGLLASAGRTAEAEAVARELCALAPGSAETQFLHGLLLRDLDRRDEAEAALSRAAAMAPDAGPPRLARGVARMEIGRLEDAVADFDAAMLRLPDPFDALAYKSNALRLLSRFAEALAAIEAALLRRPAASDAWRVKAMLLGELRRPEEGLRAVARAIDLTPADADAWAAKGDLCARAGRHEEAIEAFDRALGHAPGRSDIEEQLIATRRAACDWRHFASDERRVRALARDPAYPVRPFSLLAFETSSAEQLHAARKYTGRVAPAIAPPFAPRKPDGPIRIAYISSDLRAHAVACLIAGVIERHDRRKFEVSAISTGADDHSELRRRLGAAFDDFVDASAWSDERIVAGIRERGVDILVDLNGLSGEARLGALARRAAPVQASWLGYPGTTGAPFVDYLIADPYVIPAFDRENFSEKIVYLPTCLPADDRRVIAPAAPSRRELGLPERGFVFCGYNASHKLSPRTVDIWARILAAAPGSVLWLRGQNPTAEANLRREASARGLAPERLVFASFTERDEDYLARLSRADLFLDSNPYNAHTTAVDALWAGVPVLTRPGATFSARVAGSVLRAAAAPELVAGGEDAYVEIALALAREPARFAALREKIQGPARASRLFDTEGFTRRLELAYETMHLRRAGGEGPADIDLSN